jgi:hypothetical protein
MSQSHRRSNSPHATTRLTTGVVKPRANIIAACATIHGANVLPKTKATRLKGRGNFLNYRAARLLKPKNPMTSTLTISPSDRYPAKSGSRASQSRTVPSSQRSGSAISQQFATPSTPHVAQHWLSSQIREI